MVKKLNHRQIDSDWQISQDSQDYDAQDSYEIKILDDRIEY